MDRQLTSCTNVDELSNVIGKNSFLVRYVQDIYLCLFEKWYNPDETEQEVMSCRSVMPWLDNSVIIMHKYDFSQIFSRNNSPAVYYFSPLFFGEKSFGYTILKYDTPDTYDTTFKNWIKSISNSLEFMRMKNDIRYFTAYEDLSEQYDSLTGIYNGKGFENAVKYAAQKSENERKAVFIMLKLLPPDDSLDILKKQLSVASEISDCLRLLSDEGSEPCGRIERNLYCFATFGDFPENYAELLEDKLRLLVTYRSSCVKEWGLQAFATSVCQLNASEIDYNSIFSLLKSNISRKEKEFEETKLISGYSKFLKCRTMIHLTPFQDHIIEKMCMEFGFSEGHFRKLYKDNFDVSFHHDFLNCRIDYAKYLLCTTPYDTNTVSTMCGYIDAKYFMRIFRKCTGFTAKQYRDQFNAVIQTKK